LNQCSHRHYSSFVCCRSHKPIRFVRPKREARRQERDFFQSTTSDRSFPPMRSDDRCWRSWSGTKSQTTSEHRTHREEVQRNHRISKASTLWIWPVLMKRHPRSWQIKCCAETGTSLAIRLSTRRSEKATFAEIMELDSMSQVSNSKKCDAAERPSEPFIGAIRKMKHYSNSEGETIRGIAEITLGSAPA
jgi:hypothetical protein